MRNRQVAQTGHTMPILHPSKQLIGSGMNKTLAYFISEMTSVSKQSRESGVVETIDNVNKLVILKYDNGTKDAIDLGVQLKKNSGMGFYIHQEMELVYKQGERFDKGDVIAYDPSYFSGKGKRMLTISQDLLQKLLIAPGDFSFEDSTIISEKLGKKMYCKD